MHPSLSMDSRAHANLIASGGLFETKRAMSIQSPSCRPAAVSAAHRAVSRRPAAPEDLRSPLSRHGARRVCAKSTPFGVCLLKSGNEIASPGEPSVPENVGCLAEITQCDVDTFGMLLVQARGTTRFRLLSHRVEPSNLLRRRGGDHRRRHAARRHGSAWPSSARARKCWSGSSMRSSARAEGSAVRRAVPSRRSDVGVEPACPRSCRSRMRARQKLMELEDAGARIDVVHHYMQQHQLL